MQPTTNSILRRVRDRRQKNRPYKHRVGQFTLTANFRDETIEQSTVDIVGALIPVMTQKQLARGLGKSLSVIQKLVRIHAAQKMREENQK